MVALLDTITMSPRGRSRMPGSTSLDSANEPNVWMRQTRSNSAGSVFTTEWPRLAMPALLTRMSMAPKSARAAATIASSSSQESTDAWYFSARRPSFSTSATVSAAACSSRR